MGGCAWAPLRFAEFLSECESSTRTRLAWCASVVPTLLTDPCRHISCRRKQGTCVVCLSAACGKKNDALVLFLKSSCCSASASLPDGWGFRASEVGGEQMNKSNYKRLRP